MELSNNESSKRGLASADAKTRQRVASSGGKTVSKDRKHMSEIGRKGGLNSRKNKPTNQEATEAE